MEQTYNNNYIILKTYSYCQSINLNIAKSLLFERVNPFQRRGVTQNTSQTVQSDWRQYGQDGRSVTDVA